MKAIIINCQIKEFSELPKNWKNHVNFTKADEALLKQEGFYDVVIPVYNATTQKLGQIYFDDEIEVFTYHVIDLEYDIEAIKIELKRKFDNVLNEFAVIIARCRFIHDPAPEGLQSAIETARYIRIQTLDAINALATIEEALAFDIKQDDVESLKQMFSPYM